MISCCTCVLSLQQSRNLAQAHFAQARESSTSSSNLNAQLIESARKDYEEKVAAIKKNHASDVAALTSEIAAAHKGHAAAVLQEREILAAVASAASKLERARLNATSPEVWQARVAAAQKALGDRMAKNNAEIAVAQAHLSALRKSTRARTAEMRRQQAAALKAAKFNGDSKSKTAALQLEQMKQETSYLVISSERSRAALALVQSQISDALKAIEMTGGNSSSNSSNATIARALARPNAWIRAAEAQLAATRV